MADDAGLINEVLAETSFLYGGNLAFVEDLYARWAENPNSVEASWRAFFASLHAAESEKAPVGTFHATGKFKEELEAENDRSGDWACTKCHYTNFKECLTCARCRSLRRFEGRNQASGYCQ